MRITRRRPALLAAIATAVLVTGGIVTAVAAQAAVGCSVAYSVANSWPGGFGASVTVTNLGDPINGWSLAWNYSAGQQVTQAWNANVTLNTSSVTATNVGYNGSLATNGTANFGFNGSWNNSTNPAPSSFTLNGTTCTGGTTGPTGQPPTTTRPPTTPPTNPPTTGPSTPPQTGLVGWGTQGGGTTGGGSASSTTVTSSSALTTAMAGTNAAVIRVSGAISCSGMLRVGSNKSILGVGSSAALVGCGLNVASASNVIIRNIAFRNWDDDAINVQYSTRVWIDHNSFTNGYDGAVDIKRSSDYVTVSWNRVFGHDKSMLLGHDDGNSGEDVGHLRVTYHHNWFDGSNQRHPRVRFGNPVHVYNNYYNNVGGYGVASTMNAGVLVEGNYFENTDDPFHRGEGDSAGGGLVARNNTFVNSGAGQQGGSVSSIPYSYTLESSANVKASVTSGAGTGKIGL